MSPNNENRQQWPGAKNCQGAHNRNMFIKIEEYVLGERFEKKKQTTYTFGWVGVCRKCNVLVFPSSYILHSILGGICDIKRVLVCTMKWLRSKFFQENLDSFLAIAEELQLKGLMGKTNEKV